MRVSGKQPALKRKQSKPKPATVAVSWPWGKSRACLEYLKLYGQCVCAVDNGTAHQLADRINRILAKREKTGPALASHQEMQRKRRGSSAEVN